MSMMARFVAVAPARLQELLKSPDNIEALFGAEVPLGRLELTPALQDRMRRQAPQMLKGALDRLPPEIRAQAMRRFGMGESDLGAPDAGDRIMKMMQARMAALRQPARPKGEAAPNRISLDKAWHGLHYLLCGAVEPVDGPRGQAVLGGAEIGDDMGYGPARYFTVGQTAEIAQALQAPGVEGTLRTRFDPAAMRQLELYPGGWDPDGEAWLIEAFRALRDFYAVASAAGEAVVTAIE